MLIIHGEDTAKSRLFLNQQIDAYKKQGLDIVRLEADALDQTTLEQNLNSNSLFGQDKAIVIFNFAKLSLPLKKILLQNQSKTIILYHEKSLQGNALKVYDKAQVRLFKPNPIIFQFLESLKPGNQKQIITYYKQLEDAQEADELIFAMLVRQVRLLLTAADTPEQLKMAPWQKTRLITQAKAFSLKQIIDLHSKLYEIDKSIKTGTNSLELKPLLFNLLIQI